MSYTFAHFASAIAPDGTPVSKKTNKQLTHCVVGWKAEPLFGEPRWQACAWSTSEDRARIRASSARNLFDDIAIVSVELWKLKS